MRKYLKQIKKIEKEISKLIELSRLKQTLSRKDISMDYHTKKILGLTDKNIIFPTEWLSEKKEGGITTYVIHGRLDYTPTCCTKCGIKNEGQVIKYGTHQTTIQLLPIHSHKTVFNLKKTRFLCKECGSTFSSETSLVDRNCSISVDLKRKIMAELATNSKGFLSIR